jgi:beta-galactosidase
VEPDNGQWTADGMDLQHVRITAVDSKGRRVQSVQDDVQFEVEGDAQIVAVSNGDMTSDELSTVNHRKLWQGSAMVILRAGQQPSDIRLKVSSDKFKTAITRLKTK